MIAYEDLVVALSSWRAGQGLPANTVSFLSSTTGSVDLALPVADPVETLGTSEVHSLDDEYAMDEEAVEEYAVDEYAVDEYALDEVALDEVAIDDEYTAAVDDDEAEPAVGDQTAMHTLNYDEDEVEQTAIATDFERAGVSDRAPFMPPALAAADDDEAIEMDSEQGEVISADNLDVEEIALVAGDDQRDPHTEEADILSEEHLGDDQEGPTKFGGLEHEETEMDMDADEPKAPRPPSDTEE